MPHNDQSGPIFVIVIENDKMSVQEYQADSTTMDLLERAGRGNARWMPYGFPLKEELRPRLNRQPIGDPTCKLRMGDVVELTPALPDRFLTEHQEENQRMYNRGPTECRAPVLPCACKLSAVSIQERVLNLCMICKKQFSFSCLFVNLNERKTIKSSWT